MALLIPPSAKRDVALAEAYFSRDSGMRHILTNVQHSAREVRLQINHRGDDHFDPSTNTIAWDPYSAMRTTGGGRQSPALGLAHELAHAAENPRAQARLASHAIARYDTLEERRVIRGPERAAAHSLGESARFDHRGSLYRVATPVSR